MMNDNQEIKGNHYKIIGTIRKRQKPLKYYKIPLENHLNTFKTIENDIQPLKNNINHEKAI